MRAQLQVLRGDVRLKWWEAAPGMTTAPTNPRQHAREAGTDARGPHLTELRCDPHDPAIG